MNVKKATLILAVCAAPLAGRAASFDLNLNVGIPVHEELVVREAPPAPLAEAIPPPPGPGLVWVGGHWSWRHHHPRGWEWIPGHYRYPPHPGVVWIAGHWDRRGDSYFWVEGSWAHVSMPPAMPPPPPPPGPVATTLPPQPPETPGVAVVVAEAPPAPLYEVVTVSPGPEYVWVGGRWDWNHGWHWLPGHYMRHPHWHPGAGWESGRRERRGGGFIWIEGRWR